MLKVFGNRYAIGEMIGTGGMADVYIGEDQRLSRKVAVKVLRSDLARDPSFVARFRKEALAAAGLNHPGIVAVYDSGEEGSNSYIVMELVNGHTLREEIQKSTEIAGDFWISSRSVCPFTSSITMYELRPSSPES